MQLLLIGLWISSVLTVARVSGSTSSSSSSYCVSSITEVPPSIEDALSQAASYYPSVYSMGTILSTIELLSPTFATIESEIDYYMQSYPTMVSYMEEMYGSSWLETDSPAFTKETLAFSVLAPAISHLVHFEATHPSLLSIQASLQSIMRSDPSILSNLAAYTQINYKSIYYATKDISKATLTNPNIVAEVIAVDTAIAPYSTVQRKLASLSSELYYVSSTICDEIITFIDSPSTVSSSVIDTLEDCYSTMYSNLGYVLALTYSEPSLVTALTGYMQAGYSVYGLGSAIDTIMSQQMPTLIYEESCIDEVGKTWSSMETALGLISEIIVTSPSMYYALHTIEASFYDSPDVASSIYYALDYPSFISQPTGIASYEESHESLVSAINQVIAWETYHESLASTLKAIDYKLTSVFQSVRTILTAASYLSVVSSPSAASGYNSIMLAESVVSYLCTAMSEITYVIQYYPSISCYESVIEQDLILYTPTVTALWSAIYSPSSILSSSIRYYAELEATYPSLVSAIEGIISVLSAYPQLASDEYAFIQAADSHSHILTQWQEFTLSSESLSSVILTWSDSSSSSSSS